MSSVVAVSATEFLDRLQKKLKRRNGYYNKLEKAVEEFAIWLAKRGGHGEAAPLVPLTAYVGGTLTKNYKVATGYIIVGTDANNNIYLAVADENELATAQLPIKLVKELAVLDVIQAALEPGPMWGPIVVEATARKANIRATRIVPISQRARRILGGGREATPELILSLLRRGLRKGTDYVLIVTKDAQRNIITGVHKKPMRSSMLASTLSRVMIKTVTAEKEGERIAT